MKMMYLILLFILLLGAIRANKGVGVDFCDPEQSYYVVTSAGLAVHIGVPGPAANELVYIHIIEFSTRRIGDQDFIWGKTSYDNIVPEAFAASDEGYARASLGDVMFEGVDVSIFHLGRDAEFVHSYWQIIWGSHADVLGTMGEPYCLSECLDLLDGDFFAVVPEDHGGAGGAAGDVVGLTDCGSERNSMLIGVGAFFQPVKIYNYDTKQEQSGDQKVFPFKMFEEVHVLPDYRPRQ